MIIKMIILLDLIPWYHNDVPNCKNLILLQLQHTVNAYATSKAVQSKSFLHNMLTNVIVRYTLTPTLHLRHAASSPISCHCAGWELTVNTVQTVQTKPQRPAWHHGIRYWVCFSVPLPGMSKPIGLLAARLPEQTSKHSSSTSKVSAKEGYPSIRKVCKPLQWCIPWCKNGLS